MKRCYTISPLEQVFEIPDLYTAQFTLNGRIFPSRRKTIEHLDNLFLHGSKCNLLIHWDFIYICSRYGMFVEHIQRAIINELVSLLKYASKQPLIKGIVMHTDFPVRRELTTTLYLDNALAKYYNSQVWDINAIRTHIGVNDIVEYSICKFATDLASQINFPLNAKVLLENTTKIGPNNEGSLEWLVSLFHKYPYLSEVCGLVYDTEHHFAITGEWLSIDSVLELTKISTVAVHLNTVPKQVKPGKGLDRHSDNTICECSQNTKDFYIEYSRALDANNIYWVREVHTETMFRELKQCQ